MGGVLGWDLGPFEGKEAIRGPEGSGPVGGVPPAAPDLQILKSTRERNRVVKKNAGASLVDLGDGVLCLEFHSKMNSLGDDMVQMVGAAIDETSRGYEALVVGNQGENFSVGANLMMVLLASQEGEWDELDAAGRR